MFNAIENINFTESFWSHDEVIPYLSDQDRATALRCQIIDALQHGGFVVSPRLMYQLMLAEDVSELWFLRIDIMQLLSLQHSEERARSFVGHITLFFVGLMPESLFQPSHYALRMKNASQITDEQFIQL